MSVHSSQKKKKRDPNRIKFKGMGKRGEFLSRITKTLYYGKAPISACLTLPVTELAAEIFSEVSAGRSLERLRLEEAAEITTNTCVSPCSFVLAMLYLDRLKTCNPSYVERVVPSELFLISMMVASKFLNDDGEEDEVLNSEWATSAGLSLKEINRLEKDFLSAINWEVFIKESTFWNRLRKMEQDIALKEGKRRGWFSYTELENLLDCLDTFTLAHAIFTVSAVCLASYTAGILTVVGSAMLVSNIPTAAYLSTHSGNILTPNQNSNVHVNIENLTEEILMPNNTCSINESCSSVSSLGKDVNWSLILSDWINNMEYNNETKNRQLYKASVNRAGNIGINCFSTISYYLYSFTQNIDYFPLQIIASH